MFLVKTSSDSPPNPFQSSVARMMHQHAQAEHGRRVGERRPDDVAPLAPGIKVGHRLHAFISRLRQHPARGGENDERDDEQDEAERQQRRGEQPRIRVGELIGDHRRDGRALGEDRSLDLGGVADDEGDRHRLAERAAERQHHAADHADPRVGDDDVADDLEGRRADAVGRLLQHRRHRLEDVARDRGDERQDHQREHEARGQHAVAERRPGEQNSRLPGTLPSVSIRNG